MPSRARRAWDDRLQARAARRRANDQALSAGAAASGAGQTGAERPLPFLCECADPGCVEVAELSLGEYASVRLFADRFLVSCRCRAAHVVGSLLIEWNDRYSVVDRA